MYGIMKGIFKTIEKIVRQSQVVQGKIEQGRVAQKRVGLSRFGYDRDQNRIRQDITMLCIQCFVKLLFNIYTHEFTALQWKIYLILDLCQKSLKVPVLGAASTSHREQKKSFTHDHRYDRRLFLSEGKKSHLSYSQENK